MEMTNTLFSQKGRSSFVILSAAKDLADEESATVAFGADFSSAGRMLHFVQHDNRGWRRVLRRVTDRRWETVSLGRSLKGPLRPYAPAV